MDRQLDLLHFVIARQHIDIGILSVCLSVRLSVTFRIVSKRLNLSSQFLRHTVAQAF